MPKRQMVQPKINEISGVDHPAHLIEGWVFMKDASPETQALLARAEATALGLDPTTKGKDMPTKPSEEVLAGTPEDVQAYVKSLEDAVAAAVTTAPAAEPTEAEAYEKALETLDPGMREVLRKSQREAAEAKSLAKSLHDAAEDKRFEAMTKELTNLPKVDESFAKSLRSAHDADPDAFTPIFEVLKAADGAISQSKTFEEIGTGGSAAAGSAQEKLEGIAKALHEADATLSPEEALLKAAEQNPDLYSQHRREYSASQREA